jgi:dienelactone hydrolase
MDVRMKTNVFTEDRPLLDDRLTSLRHVHSKCDAPPWGTPGECKERAEWVRRRVAVAAGLLPERPRTPLKAKVFDRRAADGCTIEKVRFESRPGFLVTGNLYRPLRWRGQRPAVLCPHGHFNGGRLEHSEKASLPLRCMTLASLGFVVFSYDMIGYNDSLQLRHPRAEEGVVEFPWTRRASLYGINFFGLQLWNSMRAVDFLCSLPDVDPNRIGATGASGGATQTWFLGLMDERVRAMAPACMLSAHFQGGCLCEEAPLLHLDGLSTLDVVAALAPRPVLLLSVTQDWTNQNPEFEFPAMRQVYAIHGAADAISNFHFDLPHNYGRDFREHMYAWFLRRLANNESVGARVKETDCAVPPPRSMRLFPDGKPPKGFPAGERLVRAFEREESADFAAPPRSSSALRRLRAKWTEAYAETFSCEEPAAVDLGTPVPLGGNDEFTVTARIIGRRDHSEQIPALWIVPKGAGKRAPASLVLCDNGKAGLFGKNGRPAPLLKALLSKGVRVLTIDLLGTGETAALPQRSPLPMGHRMYHVFNRSLTAHRVQETLRALAALRRSDGVKAPGLIGLGRGAVIALLARPLAGPLGATAADLRGCSTDEEGFWLGEMYHPGILRLGGLRAAIALAPATPLTLIGAKKPLEIWASAVYRVQGKGKLLHCAKSFLGATVTP